MMKGFPFGMNWHGQVEHVLLAGSGRQMKFRSLSHMETVLNGICVLILSSLQLFLYFLARQGSLRNLQFSSFAQGIQCGVVNCSAVQSAVLRLLCTVKCTVHTFWRKGKHVQVSHTKAGCK